jgi:glycosyltransferase involved in cell wall biosynthesis
MRSVFIILSTIHIGGAEMRFAGLWNAFEQNKVNNEFNVFLVLNPALYEKFVAAEIIMPGQKNVIVEKLSENNFITYRANVKRAIKKYSNKGDIIHFIGSSPALLFYTRRSLLSVTLSDLNVEGVKLKWIVLTSILFSGSCDILDDRVYKKLQKFFFWKKRNLHKTTNSFCDTELYKPVALGQKKDQVVFLGRYAPVKQVTELMEAIPLIHAELKKNYDLDVHFYILGHGELAQNLLIMKENDAFKNIKVEVYYEKFPYRVLNESKVFLSLQLHNNYPSRSLLEAMAAGNIPLVTDNGDTRSIAKPEFSYYVPEKFTAAQLAEQLVQIFAMDDNDFDRKAMLARNSVLEGHTLEKMKLYYHKLYEHILNK